MAAQTLLEPLGLLLELVEKHMEKIEAYESTLKKMNSTLRQMKPIVEKMADLNQNLDRRTDGKTSVVLLSKIKEGQALINKCSKEMEGCCSCWNKPRYGKQLEELYTSIKDYCDIIVPLEVLSKVNEIGLTVNQIREDLRVQRNSRGTPMQGNPPIGGQGFSGESKEQPEQPQSGTKEANQRENPSSPDSSRELKEQSERPQNGTKEANHGEKPSSPDSSRELKEQAEQPQNGTKEANHREQLPSPQTNGASNLRPFGSQEMGINIEGREGSYPARTPNNGTSNLHPPKSQEIGNDVKSTGQVDPSPVASSASLHRPSASLEPAQKVKDSPEEIGKSKQLENANPPDGKVNKGSVSGNTTSLAPIAPTVPSKIKGATNLHPPKCSEIENNVKSMVGRGDPSPVDSSASLHRPSASLEPTPKVKDSIEEGGKPTQLEYANPPDVKLNKGSLLGNTTSLAPVAPPVPSNVKGGSNVHPPKSLEIGNDVKSTGSGDASSVVFSASLHRPSASPEPTPKMKGFLDEVGKPRKLEYANPPDDKVNKGSLLSNTTSSAPVTSPVTYKVKGASNLHPPNEIGNYIESPGRGDPSLEDFSASLQRPSASSELASKVKGFLEEANKPRQVEYANPPDDKFSKRSLSDKSTSLAPVAPPVPSKVKASPEEPYKKIIGQDSKVHSNDPTRRPSVPTAGSDSLSLLTSITSTPPKLKEPDEGANRMPNSRKAGHSISREHNSTVAKDHIPRGHPTVPEKTPDAKIIPEGVKNHLRS